MSIGLYILDKQGQVQAEPDLLTWTAWFEAADRHICKTTFKVRRCFGLKTETVKVSTVFLGMDHNYGGGEPHLFETMIFGGKHDQYMLRYTTKEDAIAGHQNICEHLFPFAKRINNVIIV
jgi:hypothetical protein